MHPDTFVVRFEPDTGAARRVVYHPRSDGGFTREEQVWRLAADGWHTVGSEPVAVVETEGEP